MKVFISHSSRDKPAVEALARHLRSVGIDAWLDKWEIAPGDDVIARMNEGLGQADAGLIVFSARTMESCWVRAEVSTLTWNRIQGRKLLIPLKASADAEVPPLLEPLCWLDLDDHQRIADALRSRNPSKPPLGPAPTSGVEPVRLTLERRPEGTVSVTAHVAGEGPFQGLHPGLPPALLAARASFLRGFGPGRDLAPLGLASLEGELATLGRQLAAFCLPEGAEPALRALVDGAGPGLVVEVVIETPDPELMGLPFETLRLADGRLLATQPAVVMLRRGAASRRVGVPLAGPLKVLVAVGRGMRAQPGGRRYWMSSLNFRQCCQPPQGCRSVQPSSSRSRRWDRCRPAVLWAARLQRPTYSSQISLRRTRAASIYSRSRSPVARP